MKQIDNLEYEQPEALWKLSETQAEESGFLVGKSLPFRSTDPYRTFHLDNPPLIEAAETNYQKAEACVQRYCRTQKKQVRQTEKNSMKKKRYLAGFLHYYEPVLNQIVADFMQRYAMEGHFEDLKQAAALGILEAAENYDYAKKAAFQSYVLQYIENELHEYVRTMRRGCTVNSDDAYKKLRTVMAVFNDLGGRMDSEVLQIAAAEAEVSPARAKEMILAGLRNMQCVDIYHSFESDSEEPEASGEEITVSREPGPYRALLRKDLETVLRRAWSRLDYRQQVILAERLGFCPECFSVLQRTGASGKWYDCTVRKKTPFEDIAISHGFSSPDTAARQYNSALERFERVYKQEFARLFLQKRTPQSKQ